MMNFQKSLGNSALFANTSGAEISAELGLLQFFAKREKMNKNPYAGLDLGRRRDVIFWDRARRDIDSRFLFNY